MKSEETILSQQEERLLLSLGYLVMRYNYAEYFVRQMFRQQLEIDSIFDPKSVKVSNRVPTGLIEDLKELSAKIKDTESDPYVSRLAEAFEQAAERRHHLVHGVFMTAQRGDASDAIAVLIPSKMFGGRLELPKHVDGKEIETVAHHFHDLAMFARAVNLGFCPKGGRATNADSTPVIANLPPLIELLPPIDRQFYDEVDQRGEGLPTWRPDEGVSGNAKSHYRHSTAKGAAEKD